MNEPFLYQGSDPIVWSPKQIVKFVRLLEQLGVTEQFCDEGKELEVTITKEMVNFSKKFLFHARAHHRSEEARVVITSATCPKKPDDDPW